MRCVLYGRVSTDRQASRELSIPAQLKAMRKHADAKRWTVIQEFIEEGVSGRSTRRPVLQALLARCRGKPRVDIVLVHKLDRLARNVYDHAVIRSLLRKHGVRLVSVAEPIDESIGGQLLENVMAAFAEFYSANLSEETKKGMQMSVERGGWPHKAPRGYRNSRSSDGRATLVVEPLEAAAVRRVFELYVTGDRSFRDIVRTLKNEGLPLVASAGHLRRFLSNRFYLGFVRWNGQEHPGNHPPLVSHDTFDAVAKILCERKVSYPRQNPEEFVLRGLVFCAKCRRRLTIERQRRFRYYKCLADGHTGSRYFGMTQLHVSLEQLYTKLGIERAGRASLSEERELVGAVFQRIFVTGKEIVDYELDSQRELLAAA